MKSSMKEALLEYGRRIQKDGWKSGEIIIQRNEGRFRDFRRWAYALGIMLRADELLKKY